MQEICQKRYKNLLPTYEVVLKKWPPQIVCSIGQDLKAFGSGKSPKIAKRKAAIKMFQILKSMPEPSTKHELPNHAIGSGPNEKAANILAAQAMLDPRSSIQGPSGQQLSDQVSTVQASSSQDLSDKGISGQESSIQGPSDHRLMAVNNQQSTSVPPKTVVPLGNPLGDLFQMCIKRCLSLPSYAVAGFKDGCFAIVCSVGTNLKESGSGADLNLAKREAAFKMLQSLKMMPVETESKESSGAMIVESSQSISNLQSYKADEINGK